MTETISAEQDWNLDDIYTENILDHFKFPRNKREMMLPTRTRREWNPLCGDEITLFVKISNQRIEDISFLGRGCAISQASISLLTERLQGITVEEARNLSEKEVFTMLGIPISPLRTKCALLSHKALHHVFHDWKMTG